MSGIKNLVCSIMYLLEIWAQMESRNYFIFIFRRKCTPIAASMIGVEVNESVCRVEWGHEGGGYHKIYYGHYKSHWSNILKIRMCWLPLKVTGQVVEEIFLVSWPGYVYLKDLGNSYFIVYMCSIMGYEYGYGKSKSARNWKIHLSENRQLNFNLSLDLVSASAYR